jgi:hypothetical protein
LRNRESIDESGAYAWLVTDSGGYPRDWQFPMVSRREKEVEMRRGLAASGAA